MATLEEVRRFLFDDERNRFFYDAVTYVLYEEVEGEILEFGVFGRRSITLLSHYLSHSPYRTHPRRLIGFDSFTGLNEEMEGHARWGKGACATNNDPRHPIMALGEPVTPEAVAELSRTLGTQVPEFVVGQFSDTLPASLETVSGAAFIHIDCDLYEATVEVFKAGENLIRPGTLIAFDDWFHYCENLRKDKVRAFKEFCDANPQWRSQQNKQYGTLCNSFISYLVWPYVEKPFLILLDIASIFSPKGVGIDARILAKRHRLDRLPLR